MYERLKAMGDSLEENWAVASDDEDLNAHLATDASEALAAGDEAELIHFVEDEIL